MNLYNQTPNLQRILGILKHHHKTYKDQNNKHAELMKRLEILENKVNKTKPSNPARIGLDGSCFDFKNNNVFVFLPDDDKSEKLTNAELNQIVKTVSTSGGTIEFVDIGNFNGKFILVDVYEFYLRYSLGAGIENFNIDLIENYEVTKVSANKDYDNLALFLKLDGCTGGGTKPAYYFLSDVDPINKNSKKGTLLTLRRTLSKKDKRKTSGYYAYEEIFDVPFLTTVSRNFTSIQNTFISKDGNEKSLYFGRGRGEITSPKYNTDNLENGFKFQR